MTIHAARRRHPPRQTADDRTARAEVTLTAHVSKGTYIRSLARDIALALGTVGHVTMLRRTKAGPFDARTGDFAGQTGRTRLRRAPLKQHTPAVEGGAGRHPGSIPSPPIRQGCSVRGGCLTGIAADDGLYFATAGRNARRAGRGSGPERPGRARLQPVRCRRKTNVDYCRAQGSARQGTWPRRGRYRFARSSGRDPHRAHPQPHRAFQGPRTRTITRAAAC